MVKPKSFESLLSKINSANDLLNDVKDFLSNLASELSDFEFKLLETYISELSEAKSNYAQNFDTLQSLEADLSNQLSVKQFVRETRIIIVKGELLLEKFSSFKIKAEQNLSQNPISNNFYQSLPTLQLPTFSGIIDEYKQFIENFLSIVNSANLTSAQKLHYLRNSLKGEASSSISGLSAIDENFEIALDILNSRYDRPKLVIQAHVKNIFDLDSITKLSASSLQKFVDSLNRNIMCLRNLNVTDHQLVSILIMHIIDKKLDSETREKLKSYKPSEIHTIDEIIKFLQDRAQFLIDSGRVEQNKRTKQISLVVSSENPTPTCKICKGGHKASKCPILLDLSVEQRIQKITELKICKNCLSHSNHARCSSRFRCFVCKGFHHSLLHINHNTSHISSAPENTASSDAQSTSSVSNVSLTCNSNSSKHLILLSTAEVLVKDFEGHCHSVRCLLDNGSMHSIVTTRLLQKLNLPTVHANISLTGINSKVISINQQANIQISSKVDKKYFWSDSKIVLGWLNSSPHQFKVFVANRMAFVLEHTNSLDWHHVKSEENPADLITRGSFLENLNQQTFWYTGPLFLQRIDFEAPISPNTLDYELLEVKNNCPVLVTNEITHITEELLNRYSTFTKLQRVTAYILRFLKNSRSKKENRALDNLSLEELNNSLNVLVKLTQNASFSDELKVLRSTSVKNYKNNCVNSLNLFIDNQGLIRVGGRIRRSNLCFDKMHPLLLPKGHNFTKLVLRHYHITYLHCGANQLLAVVRDKFWPLSGRSYCRQIARIAPINSNLTVPKLELNSALLLAVLTNKIYQLLKSQIDEVFLYSDSNVVLAWIKTEPIKLKPYVGNRILKIQTLTSNFFWLYINTKENPADCLSRGADPQRMNENSLWFHDPNHFSYRYFCHNTKFDGI
ncbi:hypothetical protein FQR65_LT14078 [Abscondita terminalis]|nr:hypothetical protein FQR65_LT14078 [Abscondita terminalis]